MGPRLGNGISPFFFTFLLKSVQAIEICCLVTPEEWNWLVILAINWRVIAFHEGNHMHALLCAVLNTVVTNRCPFNNYIPLLRYGNMTLSRLTFPTDTHISDNCTKEQSCRSTMSLLRRLKAPTLKIYSQEALILSVGKKHHWGILIRRSSLG